MIIPIALFYVAAALLMYDTAARSWRFEGRVDEPSRMFARPALAVGRHRVGPAVPSRRLDDDNVRGWTYDDDGLIELAERAPAADMVRAVSPRGEAYWIAEELTRPQFVGATEGWSPLQEVEAAERVALPLDDVDEYLAELNRRFDHALSRISCRRVSLVKGEKQCTVDEAFAEFQHTSMRMHAYRMIDLPTREFTALEAARLEALLLADAP